MLILEPYKTKVLLPIPRWQWREPSQAVPYDQLGNKVVQTRFRLRARCHDGAVAWCGWFDDRDGADAFLWALFSGSLFYERELWRLPTPWWNDEYSDLVYEFAAVTFLTATVNTQWTSPIDWSNTNNTVECVGGGANGGALANANARATGGGGGGYSLINNFVFATPGTTQATYRAGPPAGVSYFNASSGPGNGSDNSKCSAAGGTAGTTGTGGTVTGSNGGQTTAAWGQLKFNGGASGNCTSTESGSGGGAAGGLFGVGGSSSAAGTNTGTQGGATNQGATGGAGYSSGTTAGSGSPGNNGSDWDVSHGIGSGGGGSGNARITGTSNGGSGGNYGGGGGGVGAGASQTVNAGAGIQGIIVVTYFPLTFFDWFKNIDFVAFSKFELVGY